MDKNQVFLFLLNVFVFDVTANLARVLFPCSPKEQIFNTLPNILSSLLQYVQVSKGVCFPFKALFISNATS